MALPIVWAVIWIGGRFAIKPLSQVAAKQLPKVFAHVKSATKPVLKATRKNPRGVFKADGSLSRANHITPVGQNSFFWNKAFSEAAKNPKVANIFTNYAAGMTKKKALAQLVGLGITTELGNILLDNIGGGSGSDMDEPLITPFGFPMTGRDKDALIRQYTGGRPSGAPTEEDIVEGYRQDPPYYRQGSLPAGLDDTARESLQREIQAEGGRFARQGFRPNWAGPSDRDDEIQIKFLDAPKGTEQPEETEQFWRKQLLPRGEGFYFSPYNQERTNQERRKAEQAALTESSSRFTEAELSPYKKVAEPGFGQKVFGLRRSAPEIERDATYNALRGQGLVEEANEFLETWNAQHKEKLDAALGDAGNLTQFTKDDPDRETSFAEDVKDMFKKVTKKKKGGRVKPRKKVMKKMYAKGGSVRKPKRIK